MDDIQKNLLEQIADLKDTPKGAYNIRANGGAGGRSTTENIDIVSKPDTQGIDIIIKPGTKNEEVYIPVVISESGLEEVVYNDFYVGMGSDVTIIAGCGIHNDGNSTSKHDGVHTFHVGRNARVKYVEKHYADGDGRGKKIMNPETVVEMGENSYVEFETIQIKGVDSTDRITKAKLGKGAKFVVKEILMTHESQIAKTAFEVEMSGDDSSANIVSRSVAKDSSKQVFISKIDGNAKCKGHSECDAIIMDNAKISAIPEITANDLEAELIHEAAIGKIAGDQIIKLMTLGLTEEEAEQEIVNGFLK